MTISALGATAVYFGLGSTGPFSLQDDGGNPILFETNSEIIVQTTNATGEYDSAALTLTLTVDYLLTGAGLPTPGAVTLTTPLPLGAMIVIRRHTPKTQSLDLIFGGDLSLENLEDTLDRITRITQELGEQTDRALMFSATETALIGSRSQIVPAPLAGHLLGWGTGGQLENMIATGAQGPQGDPGTPGAPGAPGTPGLRGRPMPGLTGDEGPEGATGVPGKRGLRGWRGRIGPAIAGVDGEDGAWAAPGKRGLRGWRGKIGLSFPGADGEDGAWGAPGRRASLAGASFDGDLTQNARGGFWKDVSLFVNIARFDRAFVGEARNINANFSGSQGSIIPTDTQGGKYLARDAQFLSIAETGLIAVSGISRSSDQNAAPTEAIGVAGYAINDKSSGLAWGMYAEVQHESGATAGYGIEIDAKNKGSNVSPDPYNVANGVYGVWVVSGGDASYGGSPTNPSAAAIAINANAHTWNRGIIFEKDALTGSDGTTGTSIAIEMAKGHSIRWKSASGIQGANIRSDVATPGQDTTLLFSDNLAAFYGTTSKEMLSVQQVASGVNNVRIINAVAGAGPSVNAIGDDTNVDLLLLAKAIGSIRGGSLTSMAALPINCRTAAAVNFNSANTDTSLAIVLPPGYTRYRVNQIIISGASASISTANWGLFTAAAGGGVAISAAGQPTTVTSAAENTAANMLVAAPATLAQNTTSLNAATLFFRVGTAQGSAATATVTVIYSPVS